MACTAQVVEDIRWYLFFVLLMMWGFAVSYCILFRQDQEYEVREGGPQGQGGGAPGAGRRA